MRGWTERIRALVGRPGFWFAVALALLAVAGIVAQHRPEREPAPDATQEPAPSRADELPYFGFNELRWARAWQQPAGADPDAAMRHAIAAVAAAGANTSRFPVPWLDVVNAAGGWEESAWDRFRDAYEELISHGIRPVIVLYAAPRGLTGVHPNWAPPGCDGGFASPPDRAFDAEWQAFVVRAADEFDQALALQIWNEPNSRDYWGGSDCPPDPARYLELVALARAALVGAGSEHADRLLVSAGLNPATVRGSIDWADYLRATTSGGLLEVVDAVGLHPYPLRGDCDRDFDPAVAMTLGVEHQLLEAAAIVPEPTPFWVTEVGNSSAAGLTTDCRALSEADQARALGRTYDLLAASSRVEVGIVHQLVDEAGSDTEQLPNHFGAARDAPAFLEPKPAYWCLAERRGMPVDPALVCE